MFRKSAFILFSVLLFFSGSCIRKIETVVDPIVIDPSDPATFSRYIILPDGTVRIVGNPPRSTQGSNPSIFPRSTAVIISSNGSTVAIPFSVNLPAGSTIGGYYVQVVGSDMYFVVQADPDNPGQFTLPIGIPAASINGQFCIKVWVYDNRNQVSQPVTQCVDIVKLGTGALQINLAWDTDDTDIDLHVIEPGGKEIYFADDYSYTTGGQLDRDDVDGYGPENIFWDNAPDGEYKVFVHYYEGYVRTKYFITVTTPTGSRSYNGTLNREDDENTVVTIRKRGEQYTFE